MVRGCEFIEAQADALGLALAVGPEVRDNLFQGLNGSGVHLGSTTDVVIANNRFLDTNLARERVAHAEAAVTWSSRNHNVLVRDNCVIKSRGLAFGRMRLTSGNQGAEIRGNRVCDSGGFFSVWGEFAASARVTIEDNWVLNSGDLQVYNAKGRAAGFTIRNNTILNGTVLLVNTADTEVSDNFVGHGDLGGRDETRTHLGHPPRGLVISRGGRNMRIEGNTLIGGHQGVVIRNSAALATSAVEARHNTVLKARKAKS